MPIYRKVNTWLESEDAGDEQRSEESLTALLSLLPYRLPSVALASRVLRELRVLGRLEGAGRTLPRPLYWVARASLVVCLAVTAVAVAWLPGVIVALSPSLGTLALSLATGARLVVAWSVAAFSIWDLLVAIGGVASQLLSTPEALLSAAITLSAGMISLVGLYTLTMQDRSTLDAHPTA